MTSLGPRLFATPADEPRARRASDIVFVVASTLALVLISAAAVPPPGILTALVRFLESLPSFVSSAGQILTDLLALLALLLIVGTIVRRRWSILRDVVIAAAVALVIWLVVQRLVIGDWPAVWDGLRSAEPPPWYPSPRVAVPAAAVMTASPHLALPIRRIGRWLIGLAAVAVAVLGVATPLGAISGILVASMAAATVHLVFGSCKGRPGLGLVRAALAELGVATSSLGAASRQHAGYFLVHAMGDDGAPLIVKVYGRDAYDTALVSTVWRTLWYRDADSPLRFGRLQQVEHEAFLTLFVGQAGILADTVVTAGATADDDALLVLRRRGQLLADALDDRDAESAAAVATEVWSLVAELGAIGVAHGQIDERHLIVDGDRVGLANFRGATVAASDVQRRTDEAQAFVSTVALAGEQRAIVEAVRALGPEGVRAMLPFLQVSTLTPQQRRRIRADELDLDQLRSAAAAAIGAEPPALQPLRRITLGSIVRVVLPAIAIVVVISGLAGLDFAELVERMRDAIWWLVLLGFIVTQTPRITQAISTLGASPVPLPLGPVYALQLSIAYVNIAVPTAAARIAVNIRFFQRHGVPPGSAIAAGALDGFSGFIVQTMCLAVLLLFTSASLDVNLSDAVDDAGRILTFALVIAVVAVAMVAAIGPVRRFVVRWVRQLWVEAIGAVRGLRSLRRLGLLIGGSLATELLFATALGVFTRSLGFPIPLGELLLINISVALFVGLMPIPGGIGVAEGGLTFALVQAGMGEENAFAAVLLYRLSAFYLPPIWGFFAMRWLERNKHL